MGARPDGHQITGAQTHHRGDSGSLHQAADNQSEYSDDDDDSPPPRRQAANDSSLASRALEFIFKVPPTTGRGSVMKTEEDLMRLKSEFLDEFDASFREQTPPDIHLRPFKGLPLPAHKAVLNAKSAILVRLPTLNADLIRMFWSLGTPSCETEIVNVNMSCELLEALLDFL